MAKIKIMLADHQPIVREGIRALLEKESDIKVSAEAGEGALCFKRLRETKPDVLLMDISMPGIDGINSIRELKKISEKTGIVILTMHQKRSHVREALHAGVMGYLLKTSPYEEVLGAIRAAAEQKYYLSAEINADIIDNYLKRETTEPFASKYDLLTKREHMILRFMAEGYTTNEIAMMLSVSPKTVAKHRTNLMEKLEMKNMATLVRYAIKIGVVDVDSDYGAGS